MIKVSPDGIPRCLMYIHRGPDGKPINNAGIAVCMKVAHHVIGGKPVCWDHIANRIILLGDDADGVHIDIIIVDKKKK